MGHTLDATAAADIVPAVLPEPMTVKGSLLVTAPPLSAVLLDNGVAILRATPPHYHQNYYTTLHVRRTQDYKVGAGTLLLYTVAILTSDNVATMKRYATTPTERIKLHCRQRAYNTTVRQTDRIAIKHQAPSSKQ